MAVEIRPISDDEFAELLRVDAAIWGLPIPDAAVEQRLRPLLETPRSLCAFEDGRMVAVSISLPLQLTLPGGARVPMSGITWVGVLPTHRRRGLMRRLLLGHLERLQGGDEPLAGLGASESQIYRRFGFGISSVATAVEVETQHTGFRRPAATEGTLDFIDHDQAMTVITEVLERTAVGRNGMIDRPLAGTAAVYHDAQKEKEGAGPVRYVVHRDAGGEVDGVVSYRITARWNDAGISEGTLGIVELFAATEDASIALWRFCFDHDLVTVVRATKRPVDEPIALLLDDRRRWRTTVSDELHLRPVDVPALLGARRYAREDSLVIGMDDNLLPWAGGRWRLTGGLDGASCTPTTESADLVMDPAALGAALLGDFAVELLWRAGEVDEQTPGAVRRASAMFAWSPRPWLGYMF